MVFMFHIYSEMYGKIKYTTHVLLKSNNFLYLPVYAEFKMWICFKVKQLNFMAVISIW